MAGRAALHEPAEPTPGPRRSRPADGPAGRGGAQGGVGSATGGGVRTPLGGTSPAPQICRRFRFPDFAAAPAFTDHVGDVAEEKDHHP
ncbi:MAG: 4a-hydroxytetrahydrobiopterin dehydratase [Spirochaetota bacterium]